MKEQLFLLLLVENKGGLIGSTYFGKGIDANIFVVGIIPEMIGKVPILGSNTTRLSWF